MITEQIQGNIFLQVICMIRGRKVYIVLIKVRENHFLDSVVMTII